MSSQPPGRQDPDFQRGGEVLTEALRGLRERIEAHTERFFEGLDESLTRPISEAFSRAREAHLRLLEEAGLEEGEGSFRAPAVHSEGSSPTDDPGPRAKAEPDTALEGTRLRRYRNGLRIQVLEPLREALRAMEIGRVIGERWVGFQNSLPWLAEELPEEVVRTEPEDLYEPRPGEGRVTALRKAFIRGWRGAGAIFSWLRLGTLRLFRRPATRSPARAQRVPLKELARECLLGHCPLALAPFSEGLQQHFGAPLARLETAVAAWTEDWFAAEERASRAAGHLGVRFLEELYRGIQSSEEPVGGSPEGEESAGKEAPEEQDDEGNEEAEGMGGVAELCRGLSDALNAGASLPAPSETRAGVGQAMAEEWEDFLEAVRVSGSFQETSDERRARARIRRRMERGKGRASAWERWHLNSLERVHLAILLLRLREDFEEAENQLMGRIVEEALSPIGTSLRETWTALRALQEEAEQELSTTHDFQESEHLAQAVEDLLARAQALMDRGLAGVLDAQEPDRLVREAADSVAGKLSDSLRFLPESISVPGLQREAGRVVPTVSVRNVAFREMVLQTVDVLRLEAIRNSPQPLLDYLITAATESAELSTVLSYNLTAARDELRSPPEGSWTPVLEDARSLTVDGLTRTAQGLLELLGALRNAWREFTRAAHDLLQVSFGEIHTRAVAEGAVQEQMLGIRAVLRFWTREGVGRLMRWARWLEKELSRILRKTRTWGARLIHMGRTAVGDQVSQEGEAERAFEVFQGIPRLLDSLPLVYRRLYSLQPISDPSLLIGREDQLEWVSRRVEAWNAGFALPCLLSGPVGVGHTSLLNVLASTILEEYRTFRLVLEQRIRTEEDLASLLAEALELSDDGPRTLEGLGRKIEDRRTFPEPVVVLLEHVEHLFLRVPGGTNLTEDLLSFQAQTAGRVFWLSTSSGATWKILEKSEPNAANLVTHSPVRTLSREATEEAIMARHRRSGLPVEFLPPRDLNPLVRRKLRLSRGEKAKQQVLRGEFFDRLYRMSEGSLAMAILLWLRSTDFDSREGWLRVRSPRPIRFAFMEGMDLSLDFALKAFLEHGSLTMEEYGEIFGTSREEAYQVLEALRSRILLEPVDRRGKGPDEPQGVQDGERYRVRGILSQVVANRLKNRNILH